ncbi:MAG: PAS domain S-box protein [Gammaproteobacteria bacterium]|nr:PAS domain S-box protein [Gammaproteobacteria bacterium]
MTFRFKIVFGVILIQIFLVSMLAWRNLSFLRSTSEIDLSARASLSAAILAASVGPHIHAKDTKALKRLINTALTHPGEVYIRIYDAGGLLAKGGDAKILSRPFKEDFMVETVDDGVFDVASEVIDDDQIIGRVEVGFSTEPIDNMMGAAHRNTATISVVGIMISIIFSLFLGNYFDAQLKRLRNATRRIAAGDVGHQIGVAGNDELAQTASAFNTMSKRLAKMYSEKQEALNEARNTATNLLVSQRRVEAVLQNAMDGIITFDDAGSIVSINPAAEHIFGCASEQAMAQPVSNFIPGLKEWMDKITVDAPLDLQQLNLDGNLHDLEGRRQEGSSFAMELAVSEFSIEGRRQFIGIFRDISDRKASELELRKARDLEMELSRNKFEFIANVSRDIRAPINDIIEQATQLQETRLDESQAKLLAKTRASSYSLITIISDVLDFARIAAGNMTLENIPFSLYRTVEITFQRAQKRLSQEKKGLLLCYYLPANTPTTLKGDPSRLRQILFNLIDNAVTHTNKGEILIRIGVVDSLDETVRLHFEVSDSGKGIDAKRQTNIFNILQPEHLRQTHGRPGSGLGLNISRKLVEMMGGKIGVISTPGMGSTFSFEVTLDRRPPDTLEQEEDAKDLEGIRVLIVTSGRTQLTGLSDELNGLGMDVHIVEDGSHAIQALFDAEDGGLPFQLLVFDASMIGSNCLRLARAVNSNDRTHRVRMLMIATTGYRGDSEEARRAGISGYLTTPYTTIQLHDCIRAVLQGDRETFVTRHSVAVGKPHRHGLLLLIDDNPDEQKQVLSRLEAMSFCMEIAEDCAQAELAIRNIRYDAVLIRGAMAETMIGMDWENGPDAGHKPPFIVLVNAGMPEELRKKCANVGWTQLMLPATDTALLEAVSQPNRAE